MKEYTYLVYNKHNYSTTYNIERKKNKNKKRHHRKIKYRFIAYNLKSVTYLRGICDQSVDQQLHSEFKWRVLSLVHKLLEAVSVACSLQIYESN